MNAEIVSGVIQAVPTAFLVCITAYGVSTWRVQILGRREVDLADACLVELDRVLMAIRHSRTPLSNQPVGVARNAVRSWKHTERGHLLMAASEAVEDFRRVYVRTAYQIGRLPREGWMEINEVLVKLVIAYRVKHMWESPTLKGGEPGAAEEAQRATVRLLGHPEEQSDGFEPDEIERQLRTAADNIEAVLLPILGRRSVGGRF